jgi:stearoyl-CoA desaturase (delta-9 desaturase)
MNNFFSASALKVSIIQLTSLILALAGIFFFSFTTYNLLLVFIGYFLYSGIGISLMMHRYYTHKSFKFKYPYLESIFLFFSIVAGRGSPIGWVYVHRLHHAYSDTLKDPHDPKIIGWRIFFPHLIGYGQSIDKRLIKDLMNRNHLLINKYYLLIIILYAVLLGTISIELLYFFYIFPLFLTWLALDLFVFLSHNFGYRNFDTNDNSKNNWFISVILWGEGWHNNHHKNPSQIDLQKSWWEIDLLGKIIKLIKK